MPTHPGLVLLVALVSLHAATGFVGVAVRSAGVRTGRSPSVARRGVALAVGKDKYTAEQKKAMGLRGNEEYDINAALDQNTDDGMSRAWGVVCPRARADVSRAGAPREGSDRPCLSASTPPARLSPPLTSSPPPHAGFIKIIAGAFIVAVAGLLISAVILPSFQEVSYTDMVTGEKLIESASGVVRSAE